LHFFIIFILLLGKCQASDPLSSIPLSDATGLVITSKCVFLNGTTAPYNAALLKRDDGYLLFFSHDDWLPKESLYPTDGISSYTLNKRMGVARLDKNFTHIEERVRFLTPPKKWKKSTVKWIDPRVFTINDTVYVMTFFYKRHKSSKNVWISTFCPETLAFSDPQNIRTHTNQMERNWVPLISKETNPRELSFLYTLYPTVIGTIDLIKRRAPLSGQSFDPSSPKEWKWGNLCGGTHAVLMDDYYLSFFHSHVKTSEEKRCYVMGACSFSKDPPHRLLSISPYPILFDQIYSSKVDGKIGPLGNPRWNSRLDRVIFPCGFVCDRDETGREVIHVSCGENDVGIRIVTIDKKKLLETLVPIS
jgi:predicted GH43/DUF377 family glycosyl hydrolase